MQEESTFSGEGPPLGGMLDKDVVLPWGHQGVLRVQQKALAGSDLPHLPWPAVECENRTLASTKSPLGRKPPYQIGRVSWKPKGLEDLRF